MDDRGNYMNVQLVKPDSLSPLGDRLTSTYSEPNFGKDEPLVDEGEDAQIASGLGDMRVTAQTDGLPSIYSVLKLPKDEIRIDDYEDLPSASGPVELPVTAQAAAQERESKVKTGNRPYRMICLLCLVTFVLIVTVAGLSIHVSQIRQSKITSDRKYHELNSTVQVKLSALNSNLSDLKRLHSDLRHQFTEMETKYRSVNETKAQICELLTSRREQTCSEDWVTKKDRCYFVSTCESYFNKALQECSIRDSRLLEINSRDEANIVSNTLVHENGTYWIGKCEVGVEHFSFLVKDYTGTAICANCDSYEWRNHCNGQHRFICEKSAHLCTDIRKKIQDLCQPPVEPN